ncbi:hypothetical protein DFJ58DRAFT_842804 [Suillus subalutaceus]|uniref:uncharacterized protein n=1 Tax=Suillus subalutaceus TaxID=48586 RepID=UPI001B87C2EB|nr:uncharacterized protein DFJ58DRAFT_842804 [Suillus subalutaceus]KAG1848964.1 hypothetical protein DFJ58DRAFT_842804 [Suillus subalutaceus]
MFHKVNGSGHGGTELIQSPLSDLKSIQVWPEDSEVCNVHAVKINQSSLRVLYEYFEFVLAYGPTQPVTLALYINFVEPSDTYAPIVNMNCLETSNSLVRTFTPQIQVLNTNRGNFPGIGIGGRGYSTAQMIRRRSAVWVRLINQSPEMGDLALYCKSCLTFQLRLVVRGGNLSSWMLNLVPLSPLVIDSRSILASAESKKHVRFFTDYSVLRLQS